MSSCISSSANQPLLSSWVTTNKFKAKSGELLLVPSLKGDVDSVLLGVGSPPEPWAFAALPTKLTGGTYQLDEGCQGRDADQALLGWMLGCYKFQRYKTQSDPEEAAVTGQGGPGAADGKAEKPQLVWPAAATDSSGMVALAEAFYWARDMINTPAEDMGPQHLAAEVQALAAVHEGAGVTLIVGDELLEKNYPAVHTVGRASSRPPTLIDLQWCPPGVVDAGVLPLVCLVGKGVCFDSGGLDIKSAQGMKLMKKDMGGAALLLALSHVIMSAKLPVRLRLLVPALENSISGNAYRPLDVLQTRAGLTVENGNTDAEGRLILSDALYEAAAAGPDLLIDAATLTGAARTALGPDLPAVFTNDDGVWEELAAAGRKENDPLWRLPLHGAYRRMIDSKVADLSSTGDPGQAGAITAALFLQEFTKAAPRWVHIDTGAWVSGSFTGPGRPEGGEALGLRALWSYLKQRYGKEKGSGPQGSSMST